MNEDRLQHYCRFCFQNSQSFKAFWKQCSVSYFVTIPSTRLYLRFHMMLLTLLSVMLVGCSEPTIAELHPDRHYVGEHNYSIMANSEEVTFGNYENLTVMYKKFPKYFVNKAKEWPKEDLNDASSYDMPRFQFAWANTFKKGDEYESGIKIWSMKTDGTDLRLVTDTSIKENSIYDLARSPDNRYMSWVNGGGYKTVYDLQTGKRYPLSVATSALVMVWSQDSRFLYFKDRRYPHGPYYARWDSETKEISKVDFKFNNQSYIKDDVIIKVTDGAVVAYNLTTDKRIFLILTDSNLPEKQRTFNVKSLSPDGRHAWGNSPSFGFLFDLEKQTITQMKEGFAPAQILGKDARYSGLSNLSHVTVVDRVKDKVWYWKAFYDGHLSGKAMLYNGLANDGLWFKENKHE